MTSHNREFVEFLNPQNTDYVILSHTWQEGQEISYQDWQRWLAKDTGWEEIEKKSGYQKIIGTCDMTKEFSSDLEYVWIDTCCIDKTSSAELSEVINSMFSWYRYSTVCFAYLPDVITRDGISFSEIRWQLEYSRWFTRGWTLQELLAPVLFHFFSKDWTEVGTRGSLALAIENITGVAVEYLKGEEEIYSASVATRMSWASKRETSRLEDRAYSLLGIFDIHMPLLYGEGEKAFLRLQEEIVKVSTDQSIFAWEFTANRDWAEDFHPSPSWSTVGDPGNEIYSMTNLGLAIRLPMLATGSPRRFFAVLQCQETGDNGQLCIPLLKVYDTFTRHAWPPSPVALCPRGHQPTPIAIHIPRYQRLGRREDVWEGAVFAEPPKHLVLLTFAADFVFESWSTTARASLQPDLGVLEMYDPYRDKDFHGAVMTLAHKSGYPRLTLVVCCRKNMSFPYWPISCVLWDRDGGQAGRSLIENDPGSEALSRRLTRRFQSTQTAWQLNKSGNFVVFPGDGGKFEALMRMPPTKQTHLFPSVQTPPISLVIKPVD